MREAGGVRRNQEEGTEFLVQVSLGPSQFGTKELWEAGAGTQGYNDHDNVSPKASEICWKRNWTLTHGTSVGNKSQFYFLKDVENHG